MSDCKDCNQTTANCECHIPDKKKHKGLWELCKKAALSPYVWPQGEHRYPVSDRGQVVLKRISSLRGDSTFQCPHGFSCKQPCVGYGKGKHSPCY